GPVIGLVILAELVAGLSRSLWLVQPQAQQELVTNGAARWTAEQRLTPATIPFAVPTPLQIAVDPAFSTYYQAQAAARLLGTPVTPAFPIAEGWMQIFTANALLLPGKPVAVTTKRSQADAQIEALSQDASSDRHTGILQLPLLQTLLTVGSQARLLGSGLT